MPPDVTTDPSAAPAAAPAAAPVPAPSPSPAPGPAAAVAAAPAAAPAPPASLLDAAGAPAAAPAPAPAADPTKPADPVKPQGAPEAYADFTMPEGVTLDAELAGELKTIAKDLNLPQEAAQRLADLGVKQAQKASAQGATVLQEASRAWAAASQADSELGGEKWREAQPVIARARDTFASPALREMLTQTGLTNHPEVLRLFLRVGQAIGEDNRLVVGGAASEPAPTEHAFYPSMRQGA